MFLCCSVKRIGSHRWPPRRFCDMGVHGKGTGVNSESLGRSKERTLFPCSVWCGCQKCSAPALCLPALWSLFTLWILCQQETESPRNFPRTQCNVIYTVGLKHLMALLMGLENQLLKLVGCRAEQLLCRQASGKGTETPDKQDPSSSESLLRS